MNETAVWRIWNIYPRTNFLAMVWCCECGPRAQRGEVDDTRIVRKIAPTSGDYCLHVAFLHILSGDTHAIRSSV